MTCAMSRSFLGWEYPYACVTCKEERVQHVALPSLIFLYSLPPSGQRLTWSHTPEKNADEELGGFPTVDRHHVRPLSLPWFASIVMLPTFFFIIIFISSLFNKLKGKCCHVLRGTPFSLQIYIVPHGVIWWAVVELKKKWYRNCPAGLSASKNQRRQYRTLVATGMYF